MKENRKGRGAEEAREGEEARRAAEARGVAKAREAIEERGDVQGSKYSSRGHGNSRGKNKIKRE